MAISIKTWLLKPVYIRVVQMGEQAGFSKTRSSTMAPTGKQVILFENLITNEWCQWKHAFLLIFDTLRMGGRRKFLWILDKLKIVLMRKHTIFIKSRSTTNGANEKNRRVIKTWQRVFQMGIQVLVRPDLRRVVPKENSNVK